MKEGRILADLHPDELLATDLLVENGIREPLVFFEGGHWKGIFENSYFYGAIFTLLITLLTRKLLLSILLSLGFFYSLNLLFDF